MESEKKFYRVWYAQFYDGRHVGTGSSARVYTRKGNALEAASEFMTKSGSRYQTACIVAGASSEDNPFTENGKLKTIPVCVFRDTTPFYTEEECDRDNLCSLQFPEHIVREWYGKSTGFEKWLEKYTADETVGLYDFAKQYGFKAERPEEEAV